MRLLKLSCLMTAVLAAGLVPAAIATSAELRADSRESIVKVHVIELLPNYTTPWGPGATRESGGSGFVISGNQILTTAHAVADAKFMLVQKYGSPQRVPARVLFISHEADLALLTVDAKGFFDSLRPLDLGDTPELQEEVMVFGFSRGGETLSITRGVVSRVEHESYSHANTWLLLGQIDSAITPGASGGPVLSGGKVVGVAMQIAESTGEMVPTPVIKQFLADVADGRLDGVPQTGFEWQRLEATDLRRMCGLPPTETGGILILKTLPESAAARTLRPLDVVLSIAGRAIGADGTIEFRSHERTGFYLLFQEKQLGEAVELELWRGGKQLRVTLVLDRPLGAGRLVSGPVFGERPRYYAFGGLVFCPLTVDYLQAWGEGWPVRAPRHLVSLFPRWASVQGEEPVVLCNVLRGDINSGYEENEESLIVKADGHPLRNLAQLVDIIESKPTGLLVLEAQDGKQIVLDRERAGRDGPEILARYQVSSDRSEDLVGKTLASEKNIKLGFEKRP